MADEAEIHLLPDPVGAPAGADGPVRSVQAAAISLPLAYLERSWSAEYLERLARAYWAYLERISLGALRVIYEPHSRTVVLLTRRLPLLRFRAPSYEMAPGLGQVTWPIERGVLVAPAGRGRGWLRISIRRVEDPTVSAGRALVRVAAEVANFYPGLRLSGPLARLGTWIYNQTQARIHRLVTNGFLRSLARLELPPSRVGALSEPAGPATGSD
jgi:hypothetical protein